MQKIDIKASILIWSIFLSLIISISFLSISTKITKNLKSANNSQDIIIKENKINNLLKTSTKDIEILGNTTIEIENNTLKKSLKKNEIFKIKFLKDSQITLNLTNSGIILYNTGGTSNSYFLKNNSPSLNTNITKNNVLTLENFAGYSSFELISNNKFDISEKNYKIIEKIGNKEIIKSFGIIK